jgi:hypothetical protein
VLIAGGIGSPGAEVTYTIFDASRAGGYGVLAGENMLQAPRIGATAVSAGTSDAPVVWIVGGVEARSNDDLAEVWTENAMTRPRGSTQPATRPPLRFPGDMRDRPEWALTRPLIELLENGTDALVVGWYGPRCLVGMSTVVFSGGPDPTERCGYSRTAMIRNFTIDFGSGVATPTSVRNPHAFGAIARLDDGRVLVSGGLSSIAWETNNTIDVFSGRVGALGAALILEIQPTLRLRRAFHTATPLPDGGMLVVGGVQFASGLASINLVGVPEVLYLGR